MKDEVEEAARVLRSGGLVVYPTDTLFALGARIDDEGAVRRVFETKNRPRNQPLTIAIERPDEMFKYARVTPLAERLFDLLPGPITLILEKTQNVPDVVTGGDPSIGIRIPKNDTALALLKRTGPLTATSANRHGEADPATLEEARIQLAYRVDYYLPSASPMVGKASTLVDARGRKPRILRPGAIEVERIQQCAAQ